ncbi:hypothetical protein [Photobacterium chitinilyticum]|uniref:Uncharacterized protein n=1 Tax=Photobacterium chitinilyticum TaxID=2485123 RepID=A0A444JM04_9GAMM|nr:hypothetical protein [Photobacterium chitinilyticum]RWX53968.1 hypothetical protein EDI28_18700 [Photobacterium chitinilyticum]
MRLSIQGEMNIEVDGEPIHLVAQDDCISLALNRLATLAVVARVLSRLPRTLNTRASLSQLTAICPSIVITVGEETILQIQRREGVISSIWHHKFAFVNKKLWLRDGFSFLRCYFR